MGGDKMQLNLNEVFQLWGVSIVGGFLMCGIPWCIGYAVHGIIDFFKKAM